MHSAVDFMVLGGLSSHAKAHRTLQWCIRLADHACACPSISIHAERLIALGLRLVMRKAKAHSLQICKTSHVTVSSSDKY